MKYDFDKIVNREGTHCSKYDSRDQIFGTDQVLPMWIADMDMEVPPFIMEALVRRANHKVLGYGMRGDAYYDAIINWVKRRGGWDIRREWINFTPGVVAGFSFAMRALTREGDGVVINPPVYPPFAAQINANKRKVVNSPLVVKDGKYRFDFDDLDRKLAGARALLFCSPHNPTGRVFSREELISVGELCCKHNVYIISDEIHSDLAHRPHKHIHIASICKEFADRTITLIAPSKTFNVAGLSTSISITPSEEVHDMFRREMDCYHADQGNVFGNEAVIAGYNNGDEWLDQFNEYMSGNLQFIKEFIAEKLPEIKVCDGEASYIAWFDMRGLGMDDDRLRRFMIDEAKVGLSDGLLFGEEGRGHMRMVTAVPRAVIAEALGRIERALRERSN